MTDLTTPRFYLEPMSEEKHAQAIYDMWQDPVNLVGTQRRPLETTHVMIRDRSHGAKPGIENFAIMAGPESPLYKLVINPAAPVQDLKGGREGEGEAAAAPKLIGWTGVVRVAPEEIGWYVTTPCRGLGVATEAVQTMLRRYWVAQPGTSEVTALISEGNAVSERVATRAGFVRDPEQCLDNLLQASPFAYRVFETHGVQVFDALLSNGTIHPFTVSLIRFVAHIRASSLPPHVNDLPTFRHCISRETTEYPYDPPRWSHPPCPLPPVPATILRSILASHRAIIRLTVNCLEFHLLLFKELRPAHLEDESFEWDHIYYGDEDDRDCCYIGAWDQDPERKPFPTRDIGPPTWVEEQRVIRACWRIELWKNLRAVVDAGHIRWPNVDSPKERRRHQNCMADPLCFYDPCITLRSASWTEYPDHYSELVERWPGQDYVDPPRVGVDLDEDDNEAELIKTVQAYVTENRPTALKDFARTKRSWPAPAITEPASTERMPPGHLMAWKSILGQEVLDDVAAELIIEKEHHPNDDSDSETSYVGDERVVPRWARPCGYVSHVPCAHPLLRRKHRQPPKEPLSY
ncbi:hypothetical protein PG989_015231 [Apiospora arundinis]